jgi:hypothetical protein
MLEAPQDEALLLSIQQPDGGAAPAEILEPVPAQGGCLQQRTEGRRRMGIRRRPGSTRRGNGGTHSALEWGKKLADATLLPVEVREFQGDASDHLAI